jgi:hypothetical protein
MNCNNTEFTRQTAIHGLALLALSVLLSSCSTTEVVSANSQPAIQSNVSTPQELLIDIGIQPLDPGIPDSPEEIVRELIVPDVRRAESQYIAYHVKDTLELTGNWGAVRVTPQPSEAVDLTISGKIVESDGELLKIRLKAVDSAGRTWVNRVYDDRASKYSYETTLEDPFQDAYNEFANDLLRFRDTLQASDIRTIRQISALKYAEGLSPEAFGNYLSERKGKYTIEQLPAESDAMLVRVQTIKEREYLLVDTLDDFYGKFYRDMKGSYDEWRYATYDEAIRLREMQKQSRNQLLTGAALIAGGLYAGAESGTYAGQAASVGAVYGGIEAIKTGLDRRKEAEIHAESLKELSNSLGSEITPHVLEIEGQTVELTGNADAQFSQWRSILHDIYAQETGQEPGQSSQ